MTKVQKIFFNSTPVLVMVGLIGLVSNDYLLFALYIFVIFLSFLIKRERNDYIIFTTGGVLMIFFEYVFLLTKVEIFYRNSLFESMPIWLPVLWGYGFVAISRAVKILDRS